MRTDFVFLWNLASNKHSIQELRECGYAMSENRLEWKKADLCHCSSILFISMVDNAGAFLPNLLCCAVCTEMSIFFSAKWLWRSYVDRCHLCSWPCVPTEICKQKHIRIFGHIFVDEAKFHSIHPHARESIHWIGATAKLDLFKFKFKCVLFLVVTCSVVTIVHDIFSSKRRRFDCAAACTRIHLNRHTHTQRCRMVQCSLQCGRSSNNFRSFKQTDNDRQCMCQCVSKEDILPTTAYRQGEWDIVCRIYTFAAAQNKRRMNSIW